MRPSIVIASGCLIFAAAGCSSSLHVPVNISTAAGSQPAADLPTAAEAAGSEPADAGGGLDLSGNTGTLPAQIASRLGCSDLQANNQLQRYVHDEVTCLLDGDNEVTIFGFTSQADETKWMALGPEAADDSGTVVAGNGWAVEPYNTDQAQGIQQRIGGTISQLG
jgi:hypothetical protein